MKNKIEQFLQDMTYNSTFRVLEEAKDKDKLKEIAEKTGLKLPAHDLAVFECIYAYVNRENKNGCTLSKAEVEKALDTLPHKAVDFDHFRKRVVGHWVHAEIKKEKIIAYGTFYKGNFPEDFDVIQDLMDNDVLAVSFEAWGDREFTDNDSYELTDIEFAGGALLIKTEPAFDGASVLEMAQDKKERVLEMAKVMTPPKEFIHSSKEHERKKEDARYYSWDMQSIHSTISEIENLDGKTKGHFDIEMVDFVKNKVRLKDLTTDGELMVDLTPRVTVTKKGNGKRNIAKIEDLSGVETIDDMNKFIKEFDGSDDQLEILIENSSQGPKISYTERLDLTDDDFAVVKNIKIEESNKKIRIFPIHSLAHIASVKDRLEQSQVVATLEKLGVSRDIVDRKISRREQELAMKELIKKIENSSLEEVVQDIAKTSIDRELTDQELEKAYSIVTYKKSGSDASDTSLMKVPSKKSSGNETSLINAEELTEDKIKEAITEATKSPEKTDEEKAKIKERQDELGEFAKNLSDDDILDDKKYEDAKKEMEEAKARKEAIEKAETEKDKEIATLKDELAKAQKKMAEFEESQKQEKLKTRKDELAEFAKDMSDEDILDDIKFELAKKDKRISELEKANKGGSVDLTMGSVDKETASEEQKSRDRVNQYAGYKQPEKS